MKHLFHLIYSSYVIEKLHALCGTFKIFFCSSLAAGAVALLKPRNIFAIFGQAIASVIRAHGGVAVQITLPIIHSAHLASYEQ